MSLVVWNVCNHTNQQQDPTVFIVTAGAKGLDLKTGEGEWRDIGTTGHGWPSWIDDEYI
jgi:hypothetical protein